MNIRIYSITVLQDLYSRATISNYYVISKILKNSNSYKCTVIVNRINIE